MRSYVFNVELVHEEDGRWSAGIEALPGCATWGDTKEEALRNIQDAAEAYLRAVRKRGQKVPTDAATQISDEPVVAVTV